MVADMPVTSSPIAEPVVPTELVQTEQPTPSEVPVAVASAGPGFAYPDLLFHLRHPIPCCLPCEALTPPLRVEAVQWVGPTQTLGS